MVVSPHLRVFSAAVDSIMRVDTITSVSITGIASVDGPEGLNNHLAKARAVAMEKYLIETTPVTSEMITVSSRGEDWTMFLALVEEDSLVPGRERLLDIVSTAKNEAQKEIEIRRLNRGQTWRYLETHVFPKMRCAEVVINVKHRFIVPVPEEIIKVEAIEVVEDNNLTDLPEVNENNDLNYLTDEWRRQIYIKTDLPYWLMSWSNLAFEIDLAQHWSFNLPVYFSAVNYFKRDIKFRTISFQPGVRYWLNWKNTGVYFEAHFGMGWWNFAFGGDYRYQDHFRKSPTIGGGLAAGYRLPVSKNGRWAMEFGGGMGIYRLDYDRFQNHINGKFIDSKKKTVFFIDNINVSISYSFPYGKTFTREIPKGGRQ